MTEKFDVVVIGSGVGGSGVGALLAKAGKRVAVLEKRGQVGGRATSFKWKGYTLNVGPHAGENPRPRGGLQARIKVASDGGLVFRWRHCNIHSSTRFRMRRRFCSKMRRRNPVRVEVSHSIGVA